MAGISISDGLNFKIFMGRRPQTLLGEVPSAPHSHLHLSKSLLLQIVLGTLNIVTPDSGSTILFNNLLTSVSNIGAQQNIVQCC